MHHKSFVTGLAAGLLTISSVMAAPVEVRANLAGNQEVPAVISGGGGSFVGTIDGEAIAFRLEYVTEGDITQAHIHIGQPGANGGVAVFLCSNLGNGPVGTPICPPSPGSLEGLLTPTDLVGVPAQRVTAFQRLLKAIETGLAYVNVHTVESPGGEVRGQLRLPVATRVVPRR
jgi:hypothetical protein